MPARLRRRIALVLLALLAFAQVNVALAGCFMDRASLASVTATTPDMDGTCDGCSMPPSGPAHQISNVCIVHCTSDLQLTTADIPLVFDAVEIPIFVVPPFESPPLAKSALDGPPVAAPPRRILLHSFLI
ncbi:MAG TPA: hypothetical protein VGP97_25145 [Burkholderiales bacterium]|jgi:hypothetical protein|nr:hypothetical protein [Burkholderiales bacterium]